MSSEITPCAVFAFNRPEKLQQVLSALRPQNLDRLIVFVDGPRDDRDAEPVEQCRAMARNVDWVDKELVLREQNRGLPGLTDNMSTVLESYKSAVFVEDDCLPMPGFYAFMRQALSHYEPAKKVFSISGYQPVAADYFEGYPYSLVSSARFWCWGWSTWQDRWKSISPLLPRYLELFGSWRNVPTAAGRDLPMMVRDCEQGRERSWDINVAVCMLWLGQVQLLPTKGLVRNIGFDSGSHFANASGTHSVYNRNVFEKAAPDMFWLDDVEANSDYAKEYHKLVDRVAPPNPFVIVLRLLKSAMRLARQRKFRQMAESAMELATQGFRRRVLRSGSQ
ncbi:MAG: hypothetical protein NTU41_02245 [Chloroflexi bacterium]|nr:hypothetical protein [Chloroflexota bacterium]